jgi:hypothetical protein
VIAGLLAVSLPGILGREARPSTNRQLQETARPTIADLIPEPHVEDNLNTPDEFFMPKTSIARCCACKKSNLAAEFKGHRYPQ